MSQGERFSAAARAHSFRDAFRGVAVLLATQHNARIHAVATLAVLAVGFWLGCTRVEWAVLVLAIGLVWLAEGVNTALEALGDAVSADPNPLVGRAKDVAAGAVLLASIGAAAAGLLIFVPRLLDRFAGG
ncbi:MAG: diacylglycerol kinase family protein [Myxococcota bacterium]|nr:diacylglycerol kinase [Deltaproteobacteria bacterium]MCP4242139.1 diacylglycerol kinase family protein [bacterium]MDP6075214.1 diacylglycerol kinase family protein [Myxococcota bacterium]MDP6243401.1 diacylglycerol kinase family protein [Myxococcota bacterium]MDP7075019.1 diacylglycerol kinase family protein [Myxococcota bacterium]